MSTNTVKNWCCEQTYSHLFVIIIPWSNLGELHSMVFRGRIFKKWKSDDFFFLVSMMLCAKHLNGGIRSGTVGITGTWGETGSWPSKKWLYERFGGGMNLEWRFIHDLQKGFYVGVTLNHCSTTEFGYTAAILTFQNLT